MTERHIDEAVVAALVLHKFGIHPRLGENLGPRVTWCALKDCQERREAERQVERLREEVPKEELEKRIRELKRGCEG